MVAFTVLEPVIGFSDNYGDQLLKRRYLEALFSTFAQKNKYNEIETPIIERAELFDPKFFSNWNPEAFFRININDYNEDYELLKENIGILRPEGTIPVCRFIAKKINEGLDLPIKLAYDIVCYRNEPITEVDGFKRREYKQLGAEYIGDKSLNADAEVISFAYNFLKNLGFNEENINVRLNDVSIFNNLTEQSGLERKVKNSLQNELDTFSKNRAISRNDRGEKTTIAENDRELGRRRILRIVSDNLEDYELKDKWERLLIEEGIEDLVECIPEYKKLTPLVSRLNKKGVNVTIDPTVVRGFNYYTGPVFQIDYDKNVEIAGGGRYDNIIGDYLKFLGIDKKVPATGFAFGLERIVNSVKDGKKTVTFDLGGSNEN
ncbi:MAG: ATP phosphoribosyltransferase regulatory subunit [Candidatus Woesearchaeota archaeon]|nr:MAG: ATP phosphoribosyltransferase regulatory subunit [Candidatus Woesearchaeota archaeon]